MQLPHEKYDIVIIGGGAVGSGIVLDATLRGYKVILLEKNDFASGASSKSSKLVHGGVRYLEKAIKNLDKSQYNLVKEGLQERAIFLKNAPLVSKKIRINIPTFTYFNLLTTFIGLYIYKLIAGKKNLGKNKFLNKVVSSLYFPNIKKESLKGSVSFFDGSFLDSRMVISLLKSAVQNAAFIKNYCEVNEFLYDENNKINSLKYFDKLENKEFIIHTSCVINATGSNADNIRLLDDKESNEILSLSSGIHIVVKKEFLGSNEGILLSNTSDKRIIFVLPYLNYCLIGTTDNKTVYTENIKVKEKEIEYLLTEVNRYFEKPLVKDDILSSWSGIRPLIKDNNSNSTQQIVREHTITISKNALITIAGGKWTTYRKMASDVLDFCILNNLLIKKDDCKTKKFGLVGNNIKLNELEKLLSFYPISKKSRDSLILIYGSCSVEILNLANKLNNFDLIDESLPYLKVEIEYCIKFEYIKKPIDFLARRIGLCFVNKKDSLLCLDVVCEEMGRLFVWNDIQLEKEKKECRFYINNYF